MRTFLTDTALQRFLRPAAVGLTLVFCLAAVLIPGSARFIADESESPCEQEEQRAQEESLELYAGGEQRHLKADCCLRREVTLASPQAGPGRRACRPLVTDGHRYSNGLCAPLVC